MVKIILGSQSFGRRNVLENAGIDFSVLHADIDEQSITANNPQNLPLEIARAKAKVLLAQIKEEALLITADTVAIFNDEIRGKPSTPKQAEEFLRSYKSSTVRTNTAVVVVNTKTNKMAADTDTAKVFFGEIPDEVIVKLVLEGMVMKAAGGFIVEHPLLSPFVEKIEGGMDSVTGLPLKLTQQLMKKVA